MQRQLNLDILGAVSEFEALIRKVLPKNIIYQVIMGKGLEFDGYRDFMPDEDSSNIDWKASVRAQKLLARKYIEERDLKIMFLIDVGDNMVFGSTNKLKCEYAAELISALAHIILISGDRVGFVLFNDNVVRFRPPGLGEKQFNILSQELAEPLNYGGFSNLNQVLENLLGTLDRSLTLIFIVSDFLNLTNENKRNLQLLATLFETVAIVVKDPLDKSLPDINKEIVIENPSSKERMFINPHVAKNVYMMNALNQTEMMKEIFRDAGIDFSEFTTDSHFALELAGFLKERAERRVYKKQDVH